VIEDCEAATTITSDIYELGLVATIAIEDELAGQPFSRRIIHPVGFRMTDLQLQFDDRVGDLGLLDGGTVTTIAASTRTLRPRRPTRTACSATTLDDRQCLFVAGEALEGSQADLDPEAIVDNIVDLSGQYFVIDGDLSHRYVADEVLPGSRFELSAYYDDRAA
jgi:hypothetical protein